MSDSGGDEVERLRAELVRTQGEVARWRAVALEGWAGLQQEVGHLGGGGDVTAGQLRRELDAMRATLSWRVTAPLRVVRGLGRGSGRR